jgi:hypothetical protein
MIEGLLERGAPPVAPMVPQFAWSHIMSLALVAAVLSLALVSADPPAGRASARTAADAVVLRDGKVLLGETVEPSPRGALWVHVRRDWARENLPEWAERWRAAETPATRRAIAQRGARLEAWRRERPGPPYGPDDRITPWIDRELDRLKDEAAVTASPLMLVKLSRGDVRSVTRAPKGSAGLLRLGWIARFPKPETMRIEDLKGALEGRGYDLSAASSVSIDSLLPPQLEPDAKWLVRRAATEVSFDPGLRLMRYQDLVFPDPGRRQPPNAATALAAVSGLKALLGDNPGDPLAGRLRELAARGQVGALVTRLDIASDLATVAVEMCLWVRQGPDRWMPQGVRSARVRPDDLGPDAGKDLAGDPQVALAFRVVDATGLGVLTPEIKRRSLNLGAATQRALSKVRTAAEADLAGLALPVLAAAEHP